MGQNKLFGAISLEERAASAAEPITVETVIAMEENANDVALEAEKIATDIAMMDGAMDVAEAIEVQVSAEEAALEAGNVTAGIAMIAAANMQTTAKMLGMDPSAHVISSESIEASPTTALKVSVESAKETFKKVIEKIKQFFSKVASNIKKLAAKAMLMVTDYEKKFEKLQDKLDELGSDTKDGVKDTFTDGESNKIGKKFYTTLAKSGKIDTTKVGGGVTEVKDIVDLIKSLGSAADVEKAMKTGSNAAKTIFSTMSKGFDGLPSELANESAFGGISRHDGTTIKVITFKAEEVELKGGEKVTKVTSNYVTGSAKKDVVKKVCKDIKILSKDDIKKLIERGTELAKKKDDIVKEVDEVLKSVETATKDIKPESKLSGDDKDANEKKIESVYGTMMGSINTNSLKFASDKLLGYVAELKNIAYLAQVSMSKYKAADSE